MFIDNVSVDTPAAFAVCLTLFAALAHYTLHYPVPLSMEVLWSLTKSMRRSGILQ